MKDLLLRRIALGSLIACGVLEYGLDYDTGTRQWALLSTNLAVIAILLIMDWLSRRKFHQPLAWAVFWTAALAVWFDAAGNFAKLYGTYLWWDQVAHGVGSAAAAVGFAVWLRQLDRQGFIKLGRLGRGLFAVSLTALGSAIYEINEYIGDTIAETHRVTNLFDTADDMLWNIGAAIVVVVVMEVLLWHRKH